MSDVKYTPWDLPEAPVEAILYERLVAEGMQPQRWANASGDRYQVHSHDYHKVVYCVEGSIWFMLTDERD
jgi:quercetin dioxygenase-like cupin family protein